MIYEGFDNTVYFPQISLQLQIRYTEIGLLGETVWLSDVKEFSQPKVWFNRNFLNMPKTEVEIQCELISESRSWIENAKYKYANAYFTYVWKFFS